MAVPQFSDDGRTLFYRRNDQVLSAEIETAPAVTIGASRVAFGIPGAQRSAALPFPVTPRSDRILYTREVTDGPLPGTTVHVVVNWFEELRRITAEKK
jgi:hypothetical protein